MQGVRIADFFRFRCDFDSAGQGLMVSPNAEEWYQNKLSSMEDIRKGIDTLRRFCPKIMAILSDEKLLRRNLQTLRVGLNEIINAIRTEEYIENAFAPNEYSYFGEILDMWKYIRSVLDKYYFTSKFRLKSMLAIEQKLKRICILEEEFLRSHCSRIERM